MERALAGRHGDTAHEDLVRGSHRGVLAHHGQWQFDFGVCIQLAILVISNGSSGVAPATDQLQVSACANTDTNRTSRDSIFEHREGASLEHREGAFIKHRGRAFWRAMLVHKL